VTVPVALADRNQAAIKALCRRVREVDAKASGLTDGKPGRSSFSGWQLRTDLALNASIFAQAPSAFPQSHRPKSLVQRAIRRLLAMSMNLHLLSDRLGFKNASQAVDKNFFRTRIRDDFCL
jgi:hypothetical protein